MQTDTRYHQEPAGRSRLSSSLHSAQAQGLLRHPEAVRELLMGIVQAITHTVEGNADDPETAWALQSEVYWDHFEMDIKEALLTSFAGLDPTLCGTVRQVIDETVGVLKRRYHGS